MLLFIYLTTSTKHNLKGVENGVMLPLSSLKRWRVYFASFARKANGNTVYCFGSSPDVINYLFCLYSYCCCFKQCLYINISFLLFVSFIVPSFDSWKHSMCMWILRNKKKSFSVCLTQFLICFELRHCGIVQVWHKSRVDLSPGQYRRNFHIQWPQLSRPSKDRDKYAGDHGGLVKQR